MSSILSGLDLFNMDNQMDYLKTGVKNVLGDPKKGILKISIPLIIGMSVLSTYYLIDAFWLAGIGADALAAVGLFFPFFLIIIALGSGIGIGGSSAISRRIGEGNTPEANNTAVHSIVLSIITGILISIFTVPFVQVLFQSLTDNSAVLPMAISYAAILFSGATVLLFPNVASAVLRAEGNAKRAMYGLLIGGLLNIILDPLFIFHFNLGVSGAAWATLISSMVSSVFFVYWLFIKQDTFLRISSDQFQFNVEIIKNITKVGIPQTLSQIIFYLSLAILNVFVLTVTGTDGIAVFTSGLRIFSIAIIPQIGLGAAATIIIGSAYGAKKIENISTAYFYAIKIGFFIELVIAISIFIFAPQIATIFTYSAESGRIFDEIITFLRITAFLYPIFPVITVTVSLFNGIGHGINSLISNFLIDMVFQLIIAFFLGISIGLGLTGIWLGIVLASYLGAIITFIWSQLTIKKFTSN